MHNSGGNSNMANRKSTKPAQAGEEGAPPRKLLVKKAVQAIESRPSNKLSLGANKMLNVLLLTSYENMLTEDWHHMSVSDLTAALGMTTNNTDHIKSLAEELLGTVIDFNVLKARVGNETDDLWRRGVMFTEIAIGKGVVAFQVNPTLRARLYNPEMYALLDLQYQQRFVSSYTLRLYELCSRFRGVKQTAYIDVGALRGMLSVASTPVYEQFKFFNSKILKPSIAEINEKSDIKVEQVEEKLGRSVVSVKFKITEQARKIAEIQEMLPAASEKDKLQLRMRALGIKTAEAKILVESHEIDYLKGNIEIVEDAVKLGKCKSPTGYLMKALEHDYRKPAVALAPKVTKKQAELFVEAISKEDEAAVEADSARRKEAKDAFDALPEQDRARVFKEFLDKYSHLRKNKLTDPESPIVRSIFSGYLVHQWYATR
jgi:hypothetical protein